MKENPELERFFGAEDVGVWLTNGTPENRKTTEKLENARPLLDGTVKYLNVKLKELYGSDEDRPFTATISAEKLFNDANDVVVLSELDGEQCYYYLFDNDRYGFAGTCFIKDDEYWFTDEI